MVLGFFFGGAKRGNFFGRAKGDLGGHITVMRYETILMQCSVADFSMNITHKCHFKMYVINITNSACEKMSNSDAILYTFCGFLTFVQNLVF